MKSAGREALGDYGKGGTQMPSGGPGPASSDFRCCSEPRGVVAAGLALHPVIFGCAPVPRDVIALRRIIRCVAMRHEPIQP
jgi:hypothetical protein